MSTLLTPQQAADTAIAAVERNAEADWKNYAMFAVRTVAKARSEFTTDAVWFVIERDYPNAATHEPRALGAIMRKAVGLGVCAPTERYTPSSRVNCHARPVRIWRSLLKAAE